MSLEQFANSPTPSSPSTPWTTLASGIDASVTSLTVASAAAFPASAQYRILIGNELMLVTAGAGTTTWTVTRGVESTTAAVHASGAGVSLVLTAASLLRSPGALAATGDIQYLASTGAPTPLAAGATGTYLRYASGLPTAAAIALGDLPAGTGLTASTLAQFAATTSAQLAGVITNETGTGVLVFNDTPTLIAPLLGTPTSGVLSNCTGLPLASVTGLGTGVATWLGTPSSANLAAALTDETGSGAAVFATSPTLVTPILGTPQSGTLTNCTLPVGGLTGLAANVATWLATPSSANLIAAVTDETGSGALVFANTPTLIAPLLGTPTSGTLSLCTGLPISTGVSGLGTGVATFLATPSSANLLAALTDETGTGACVFANTPTLVTPVLGVATATSLNGNTFTTGTYTLTGVAGKTLTFNKSLTLEGTDATTMTFPTTSATIARTDAAQTFTGTQTFSGTVNANSVVGTAGGNPWFSMVSGGTSLKSDIYFAWTSGSSAASGQDTFLYRGGAAATLQLGQDVNGAAVAQKLQSCNAITGTDVVGSNFTIASGKGTGAGAVSSLIFQTPTVTTTGTTAQVLATRLTLTETLATLATPLTITETVGSSGLTITGATQTSNFPVLSAAQTWNNSGTTFIGAKFNVTNTASAAASRVIQVASSGTEVFGVDINGMVLARQGSYNNLGYAFQGATTTGLYLVPPNILFDLAGTVSFLVGSSAIVVPAATFGFCAGGNSTADLIFTRVAAANLQLGADLNGAAISQTINACNGITGTDKTGGNLTIASGKGTGAGAVSSLIFQTPTVLTTGTTAQSLVTRLTLTEASATFATPVLYGANYLDLTEMTAPAAGATNHARLYAEDTGGGKTRLVVIFPTGAAQVLATEP